MAAEGPFGIFKLYLSFIQLLFCLTHKWKDHTMEDFIPSRSSILTQEKNTSVKAKQIYHTLGTVPTSNRKIVKIESQLTLMPHFHTL